MIFWAIFHHLSIEYRGNNQILSGIQIYEYLGKSGGFLIRDLFKTKKKITTNNCQISDKNTSHIFVTV